MKKTPLILTLLAGAASLQSLTAAVIYDEDYETTPLDTSDTSYSTQNLEDENVATPFGSPNQYFRMDSSVQFVRLNDLLSPLTTYQFDMYEPSAGAAGTMNFGIGNFDINNTRSYTSWTLDDGVITNSYLTTTVSGSAPTLSLDTHYTAFVLYNGSGSTQNISGAGSATIDDGHTALFFYDVEGGTLIDGGRYSSSNSSFTPDDFLFREFSGDDNDLLIDNVTVQDTLTVVPEPSSLALLGLAGLLTLGLVRRRA